MMVPLKLLRSCVFCLVLCVGSTGCVRVPEQAVVLSNVVGERIGDMQASHEKFVAAYFQLTRERLEDFITQRWVPTFLGNFVKEAQLIKELVEAQSLTDKEVQLLTEALQGAQISDVDQVISAVQSAFADPERGQIVLEFSEGALKQIELKRKSLIDPINAFEAKTLDELRKAYSQLKQAQSTVTGHLSSIKEVTDAQDKILERLGLTRQRDSIIQSAIDANEKVTSIIDAGKDAAATVSSLEKELTAKVKELSGE